MRLSVTLGTALAVAGMLASPGEAMALPGTCEHRGVGHIERHGGKLADDTYHRSNGERITCGREGDDHRSSQTPTPTTRYVPVPSQEEDDNDGWRLGRNKHRWWRND